MNVQGFIDCLPRLIVAPKNKRLSRILDGLSGESLEELRCYRTGNPCTTDCAAFGAKRNANVLFFVCRAPSNPITLGTPDEGFDREILSTFFMEN